MTSFEIGLVLHSFSVPKGKIIDTKTDKPNVSDAVEVYYHTIITGKISILLMLGLLVVGDENCKGKSASV